MSHSTLTVRLGRLEQGRGDDLPLYLRRWLGEPLTPDQHAIADADWARVSLVPIDTTAFSPEAQAWLRDREPAA